jgi:hypothetical protein
MKAYWARLQVIFYRNVIVGLFTKKHFMALVQCLYIANPSTYVLDKMSLNFDKMDHIKWLIDVIIRACKHQWNSG